MEGEKPPMIFLVPSIFLPRVCAEMGIVLCRSPGSGTEGACHQGAHSGKGQASQRVGDVAPGIREENVMKTTLVLALSAIVLASSGAVRAAEIKVLHGGAFTQLVEAVVP